MSDERKKKERKAKKMSSERAKKEKEIDMISKVIIGKYQVSDEKKKKKENFTRTTKEKK